MKPLTAFCALIFLLSFSSVIEGRRCPGRYWKTVMKKEPMPQVISGLLHERRADNHNSDSSIEEENWATAPCETSSSETGKPVRDFDIRPNLIIYHSRADSRTSQRTP